MPTRTLTTTRRYSISWKVAGLFLLLALMGVGNWLVLSKSQKQLEGAEKDINAIGSLRYLSQKIQVSVLGSAINQVADRGAEELIAEFEGNLDRLEARGMRVGSHSGQAINRLSPVLASVRSVWSAYRGDVQFFLELPLSWGNAAKYLPRLSRGANRVLEQANHATLVLTEHVGEIKREASATLASLALVDLAILLAAFFAMRKQIVCPLRRLADASTRYAGGEYGIRTGYRSQDEIGQVSEAFDYMAEQTPNH